MSGKQNWLKAQKALTCTRDGLAPFVADQTKKIHQNILHELAVTPEKACSDCTIDYLLPKHYHRGKYRNSGPDIRPCPKGICSRFCIKIKMYHSNGCPNWSNTNSTKWCSDYWEYAKCYITIPGYSDVHTAAYCDISALLSICIKNGFIGVDSHIFRKCLNMSKEILQSTSHKITNKQLSNYINKMICVLEDKELIGDTAAAQAIQRLQELKRHDYFSKNKIADVKEKALTEFEMMTKETMERLNYETTKILDREMQVVILSKGDSAGGEEEYGSNVLETGYHSHDLLKQNLQKPDVEECPDSRFRVSVPVMSTHVQENEASLVEENVTPKTSDCLPKIEDAHAGDIGKSKDSNAEVNEEPFPTKFEGISVDVREGGVRFCVGSANAFHDHVRMGCQISSSSKPLSFGTLGGFVEHPEYGLCGFTCAHVILNDEMRLNVKEKVSLTGKDLGQVEICQTRYDLQNKIGRVVEVTQKEGNGSEAGVELALFKIERRPPTEGNFLDHPRTTTPIKFESGKVWGTGGIPTNPPQVQKYGSVSGLTYGQIQFDGAVVKETHADKDMNGVLRTTLYKQYQIKPYQSNPKFSERGDSGALVFMSDGLDQEDDLRCIGMVQGIWHDGTSAVTPITAILEDLKVTQLKTFIPIITLKKMEEMEERIKSPELDDEESLIEGNVTSDCQPRIEEVHATDTDKSKDSSEDGLLGLCEQDLLGSIEPKKLCLREGRTTSDVKKECENICAAIKAESDQIVHVFPAYELNDKAKIVFVVFVDREITLNLARTLDVRIVHNYSDESKIAMYCEENIPLPRVTSTQIGHIIDKYSEELMRNHTYLSAISASSVVCQNYGTNNQKFVQKPCIVLSVLLKHFIPINEKPFPTILDGIAVDVREGGVQFFPPFSVQNRWFPNMNVRWRIYIDKEEKSGLKRCPPLLTRMMRRHIDSALKGLCEQDLLGSIEPKKLCLREGRTTSDVKKECEKICAAIKAESDQIVHVFPAYELNDKAKIVFVVFVDREITLNLARTLDVRIVHNYSDESKIAMYCEENIPLPRVTSTQIGHIIDKYSEELMRNHTYLSAISASSVVCQNYGTNNQKFVQKPCIVLSVLLKHFIPINEKPFPTILDGIDVDVREGGVQFFPPFSVQNRLFPNMNVREITLNLARTLDVRIVHNYSDESKIAMYCEENIPLPRVTSTQIGHIIDKYSEELMRNHTYLSAISASSVVCQNYGTNNQKFVQKPCIVLSVLVKHFIPINEKPFPTILDGIAVDVREGGVQFCGGSAGDFQDQVRMGCKITSTFQPLKYGTLGGFVEHPEYGLCGVTCAHVILDDRLKLKLKEKAKVKENCLKSCEIFQPFSDPVNSIGTLVEVTYKEGGNGKPGVDLALFKIEQRPPTEGNFPDYKGTAATISYESGKVWGKAGIPSNQPRVQKFGFVTELTYGEIQFDNAVVRERPFHSDMTIAIGDEEKKITTTMFKQYHIKSNDATVLFSKLGDSGALVFMNDDLDSENGLRCIGMVVGVLNDNTCAVTPITAILEELQVTQLKPFPPILTWKKIDERLTEMEERMKRMEERGMEGMEERMMKGIEERMMKGMEERMMKGVEEVIIKAIAKGNMNPPQ